jgi:hypothetical protein
MPRKSPKRRVRSTSLDRLAPFDDDCLMVVIETPKGSPNKLAFKPRYGTFVLKGVLPAGAVFPFDFGFVGLRARGRVLGGDRTQLSLSGASQPRIDPMVESRLECRPEVGDRGASCGTRARITSALTSRV